MIPLDVKQIETSAKKEMAEERMEEAKGKLKDLYARREKAELVVRNIDREIKAYLEDVAELSVYASAGVNGNLG